MASVWLADVSEARQATESTPSASKVYRHKLAKDGFPTIKPTTLYEMFAQSVAAYADQPCLGYRPIGEDGTAGPYEWLTYQETADKVTNIASGLAGLGVATGQRVGVYGANSPEWMIAMQACNRMSYHCVPLYDSLGENAIEYIVNHSEAVVVFVQSSKLDKLAKSFDGVDGLVKSVIFWGAGDPAATEAIASKGIKVLSFDALIAAGSAAPAEPVAPQPDDLCTIMYTSGTTGEPKGVMLKHSAVVSVVAGLVAFLADIPKVALGPGDSMLSYLPLAHIFDRTAEEMVLYVGGRIGYWQGNPLKLIDDIGAVKPTLFIGVPRIFERIYSGVTGQIKTASVVKKLLFNYAYARKLYFINKGLPQDQASPFFDRLVFSKIRQRLGGAVRLIVSGGAPLAAHVEEFLKVTMCAPVVQGYGLTETCAASCIAVPNELAQFSTVGPPMPCTELRFESVPEMGYDALDPDSPSGEVLLRGPGLFAGYYKQPDKTEEAVDSEGWFHSGDIGRLTPGGGLKIVDRKKNIFKLSQGEYIAVEKLEATFKKAAAVEQVWVYGNSFKSTLVAVVVPKEDALTAWAAANGVKGSFEELVKEPKAAAWILGELTVAGKADKLKGFEMIKAVHLDSEQFTIENELMTPTFKLKRPQLQKRYQADIDAMYAQLGQ